MRFIKKFYLIFIIIAIFAIPFFWLKSNQVNLGGDSSRLYFYDPYRFLTNYVLYGVNPWNLGEEMVGYFMIPFVFLLQVFQVVLKTPHNVINFFNAFSLLIAFLGTFGSVYVIITDAVQSKYSKQTALLVGVLGGMFYIFAPTMTNWDRAIITFNQIFLDPGIFFLLYKYFQTKKSFYMIIILLVTFFFASNFSFIGAPTFFSFYPFVFLFFLIQYFFLKGKKTSLKKIFTFLILFVGIQAFHLLPQVFMLFNPTTNAYKRVFAGQIFNYVDYFKQVAQSISVQNNFLGLPQYSLPYGITFFIFPLICLVAFLGKISTKQEKKLRQVQIILSLIFAILLFFISAKITTIGFNFYANLFHLPGFGMFRNFHGQFVTAFFFFYSLLIGTSLYSIFMNLGKRKKILLTVFLIVILLIRGWPLLSGSMLYLPVLQATNNTSSPFVVPQSLVRSLSYISSLPEDSKILTLPLTDFGYQMVAGASSGLYIGPSFIGPMTLKKDFTGYDAMDVFGETFLSSVKSHDYDTVKNILAVLNIGGVFWERNQFVYEKNFPNFPYQTTEEYLPTTSEGYKTLLNNLPVASIKQFAPDIEFLSLSPSLQLPFIFPSTQVIYTNAAYDTPYLLKGKPLNTTILPEVNYSKLITANSFEAEPKNTFIGLNDNMQFHQAIPQVSWQPGSWMYPFILWKENRSVTKSQGLTKFINAYLFLAKRVEELNKWKDSLLILHTNTILQEPKLWEISKWKEYNSWEMVLSHYYYLAQQVIDYIKQEPQEEGLSDQIIASEQLEQHKYRLLSIIDTTDFSPANKRYLSSYINTIFNSLESNLHVARINTSSKTYNVSLPAGTYKAHILKAEYLENVSMDITDKAGESSKAFDVNGFSNSFSFPAGEDIALTLHYSPQNLADDFPWESSGSIISNGNETDLTVHNKQDSVDAGIAKKIDPLPGINQYAIYFQYNTNGKKFIAKLLDKRNSGQKEALNTTVYSSHVLQSNDWKLYQTIVTLDPKTVSLILQVINDENEGEQQLSVKDLSIVPVVTPIVTLEKQEIPVDPLPHITFQRINPTKYKVIVEDAKLPFVLTMLNKYSSNWKVYGPYPVSSVQKTNISYLQGIVTEGVHGNVFFDKDTLRTLFAKPLADSNHFVGEGYANSWIITPRDVQKRKTYELIIELQSQKLFYLGSIITLVTIIILVVVFFVSIMKLRKNSTLQRKRE